MWMELWVVGEGGGGDNGGKDGRKEGLQVGKQPVSKLASEEVSAGASWQ
jgi:hypothetical protein